MYRYGEDFNEEIEMSGLLEQFLEKKRCTDKPISKESTEVSNAAEINTDNYLFDI